MVLSVLLLLVLVRGEAWAAGCNHNGTCGDSPGEDCESCPSDCDPRPTFTASSHNVTVGQPIQFEGRGGDQFPVFYLTNSIQLSGESLSYSYSTPGDYTVRFGGVDNICHTPGLSDPQTIHVEGAGCNGNGSCDEELGETCETCPAECDPPPTFNAPLAAVALEPVPFAGVGEFQGTPSWSFGDGNTAPGQEVFHTYWNVGTYDVRFTAKDQVCRTTQVSAPRPIQIVSAGGCNEDGLCQAELGETCFSCATDCPSCSGPNCQIDGTCDPTIGETCTTCAVDCDKRPTFTASTTTGVANHPIVFEGSPMGHDPNAKWDFGVGAAGHIVANPYTFTYSQPGIYNVKFTSSDLACNTPQDSVPVAIRIAAEPPCPLEVCDDAAVIESISFPSTVCAGTQATATVTVRNVGSNTWTREAGYKLGTLNDPSPFASANRVELPPGLHVPRDGTHTFTITLDRAPAPGEWKSSWRMVREYVGWFGGVADPTITVASGCGGGGGGGPEPGAYRCFGTVKDALGVNLAERTVRLQLERQVSDDRFAEIDHKEVRSRSDGSFSVAMPEPTPIGVDRITCRVTPKRRSKPGEPTRKSLLTHDLMNPTIELDVVEAPTPTDAWDIQGRKAPSARLALYREGPYDKAVILPEPMNNVEQKRLPRNVDDLWWLYQAQDFMRQFKNMGVDVWILNTPRTGQNIHEQAAELAQAIDWATHDYPASLAGGAPGFSGQTAVLGISLGGMTSRLATARWEADAAWRNGLTLSPSLPVSKIVFVDAPLRGAQVNRDLQDFLWDPPLWTAPRRGDFNLNSCAFQQLVFDSTSSGTQNHDKFYLGGTEIYFEGNGICDLPTGNGCVCEAGPAVETIGGDGFANVPIAAYSDGGWGVPNQCYEGENDTSAAGDDICPDTQGPVHPLPNDTMIKFTLDDWGDRLIKAAPADLVPGSRQTAPIGDFRNVSVDTAAYFAGTFIPITSSQATSTPVCRFGSGRCRYSGLSNPHVKPNGPDKAWILAEIASAVGATLPSLPPSAAMSEPLGNTPGQPVAFDGTPSAASGGTLIQHRWDFGDGTVKTGSNVAHSFEGAGVYDVRLTVTDDTGRTDSTHRRLRIGPPNQAPRAVVTQATTGLVGQSLAFDASGSEDLDGAIENHNWTFGDGAFGEGPSVSHAYARPGTYAVGLTLIDDEGRMDTTYRDVVVTDPSWGDAPAAIAPAGCAGSTQPEFSWGALPWATRYWLQVYSSGLPAPLVDERELTSTEYTPLSDLPAAVPLRWRVRACNGQSCGAWSAEQSFQAACAAPPAPSPVAPAGCLITAQPTLSWTGVAGATSYDLTLERVASGQLVQSPNVAGTSYLVPSALAAFTEYRFRVRAKSGATAGAWSPYRFFTTHCLPEMVGTPSPLDPANASYTPIPLFTWETASNAADYQLEVTSPGLGAFTSAWYAGASLCGANGRCSLTLPAALIGGASSWRVRARNSAATGPWSPSVSFTVTGTVQSPWALVAVADFDADGHHDFVWQHASTGDVRIWLMTGNVRKAVVEPTPQNAGGGQWEVGGAADFNADSKPDLLIQNVETGELSVWFMNGTTRLAVDTPYPDRPSGDVQNWRVQAVRDYNADGKPDLLWHHQTDGWVAVWLMDGIRRVSVANPTPNRPTSDFASWTLATAERISPKGRDAHQLWVWQHGTAGWLVGWQMDGLVRDGTPAMVPNLPEGDFANWKVVAAFDADGDGKTDLVLRNRAVGANVVWRMNGATRLGTLPLDGY